MPNTTNDMTNHFTGAPGTRNALLPAWVRGLAATIFLFSLVFLFSLYHTVTELQRGVHTSYDIIVLLCSVVALCSGSAAAGLLMEYGWGLKWSLLTSAMAFCAFIAIMGYDLFFYKTIVWRFVGMEVFALLVTACYLRALWRIKDRWKSARQSPSFRR